MVKYFCDHCGQEITEFTESANKYWSFDYKGGDLHFCKECSSGYLIYFQNYHEMCKDLDDYKKQYSDFIGKDIF